MSNLKTLIFVKCIDGKERLKVLAGIYCKHYKFDKDCMQGGCCFGSRKYIPCLFSNPLECKHFELKKDARFKQT